MKKIGLGKQFQVSGYFCLKQKSFLWIVSEKFRKIFLKDYLSVSESISVHEIQDLSAGRTRTVRVRYAHPHSAGFLDHYYMPA